MDEYINSFTERRNIVLKRQWWSVFAAKSAKFLTVAVCLTAWIMVCISIVTDGSTVLLLLSAAISTAIAIPIYIIASATVKASDGDKCKKYLSY
jgi:hypothetical protein